MVDKATEMVEMVEIVKYKKTNSTKINFPEIKYPSLKPQDDFINILLITDFYKKSEK
jgi:hypothetical protein